MEYPAGCVRAAQGRRARWATAMGRDRRSQAVGWERLVGVVMSGVAIGRGPRGLPEPPPRRTLRLPWREVGFVAVCFGSSESSDGAPFYGLVPVEHGRVHLVERLGGEDPAGLAMALERRYLVAWSAARTAVGLEAALGGTAGGWLRRTIDLKALVGRVGAGSEGAVTAGWHDLSSAAAAFRVPSPGDGDAPDAATTIATLFLVVATKLKALGFEDTRSLIRGRTGPR